MGSRDRPQSAPCPLPEGEPYRFQPRVSEPRERHPGSQAATPSAGSLKGNNRRWDDEGHTGADYVSLSGNLMEVGEPVTQGGAFTHHHTARAVEGRGLFRDDTL